METNNQNFGYGNQPDEAREWNESQQEGSGYTPQREQEQQDQGNDATFSEQIDVTPPDQPEIPAEGPARADFSPQHHNRGTGRMVGHEPGTESI
jgi:hypothetical protein